jgi:3-hydroxymyristoyl/3-hydroxydecanoyl-(acyl carrier protein) dehydratase
MHVNGLKYDDKHGEATVIFSSDDPLFRGHFNYQPILPGVALVDAVVQIVSQACEKTLHVKRIMNVKFFQVVQPEQSIGLKFDWSQKDGFLKVQARWDFNTEQKIAALSCDLVEETT